MPTLSECVVLHGPDLLPHHCARFAWNRGVITAIDLGPPAPQLEHGAVVVIPGLTNAFTQLGDSPVVDGAAGLPPAQAFARPDGPRARMFADLPPPEQYQHVVGHLLYLARTGVVRHLDFCEPGSETAQMLREAAQQTGVESLSFGRLERPPTSLRELAAGDAQLSGEVRSELGNLLNVVDGFAASGEDGLVGLACQEIRELTTDRHKLRALACPAPDFARLLGLLDPHLVAPFTGAGPDEIAALVAGRKPAVLTPRADASLGLAPPPLAALLRAGAPLLLGTGSVMLTSPNLWAELDFAWKLARQQSGGETGPDPATILHLVTRNLRPVLGGDCHGHLEKGLPADFAVLNFQHPHLRATRNLVASLVTRVTPEEVLATYRQGEPIWRVPEFNP
jgi:5-methylthioadenosine/S-adenosylhomocysteine deaminase